MTLPSADRNTAIGHHDGQDIDVAGQTNGHANGHSDSHGQKEIGRKVAIVTGATSGMGIDLAKHLHDKGYRVAIVGRNAQAGKRIASEINDHDTARFFQADVASYDSQASVFTQIWRAWNRIDLLCANAGIVDKGSVYIFSHRSKPVDEVPPAPDLSCTDIDYKGVIYGIQLATHFMRHNTPAPGGKIIVNASIGGIFPHRSYPEYCGAKAAVIQYVRGVAPLLKAKEDIYVNCVLPGAVQTPIVPKEMIEAMTPECVTPVETIIKAHDEFIDDERGMVGQALEGSADQLVYYDLPGPGNGYKTKRATTVWEPLFKCLHGENSDLPDAIADKANGYQAIPI